MMEKTRAEDHGISGQNHLCDSLKLEISQLSELNRSCLLGLELALLFAQNQAPQNIAKGDFESALFTGCLNE